MHKPNTSAPAPGAKAKKPAAPKNRFRKTVSFTPRPDLWEWATAYFPHTRYRNVTAFLDAKLAQHARMKRKATLDLEIKQPKDQLEE